MRPVNTPVATPVNAPPVRPVLGEGEGPPGAILVTPTTVVPVHRRPGLDALETGRGRRQDGRLVKTM